MILNSDGILVVLCYVANMSHKVLYMFEELLLATWNVHLALSEDACAVSQLTLRRKTEKSVEL